MNSFQISDIEKLIIHYVGNKTNEDGYTISDQENVLNPELKKSLLSLFTNSFRTETLFHLSHISNIALNEVYAYISKIFEDKDFFKEESKNLAKYLYECSNHPKIKGGEFYVVFFSDCFINGQVTEAIGLFKSENRDTFLKVNRHGGHFELESIEGINIKKVDKGCIIFNVEREKGYVATIVDDNKGKEAIYWVDDFLQLSERNDEYNNTQKMLSFCKNFVTKEINDGFDVPKALQAELLNKSIKFFKENDSFDLEEFANDVIEDPKAIKKFYDYKTQAEEKSSFEVPERFTISNNAVKKQSKIFKSVVKLDKNFHIYIHGDSELIEQGTEDDGRKYYKIYYREES